MIAVVDYGAGNLRSVARALAAAGATSVEVTSDPARIASASRIVLPGVGAFAQCITALRGAAGIEAALAEAVVARGTPFLGICKVTRLIPNDPTLKIPHMGWNAVTASSDSGVAEGDAYFVHSYRFDPDDSADICAVSDHGGQFPAIVARGNITGVQFHPEKSQAYGLAFLKRWLAA